MRYPSIDTERNRLLLSRIGKRFTAKGGSLYLTFRSRHRYVRIEAGFHHGFVEVFGSRDVGASEFDRRLELAGRRRNPWRIYEALVEDLPKE